MATVDSVSLGAVAVVLAGAAAYKVFIDEPSHEVTEHKFSVGFDND